MAAACANQGTEQAKPAGGAQLSTSAKAPAGGNAEAGGNAGSSGARNLKAPAGGKAVDAAQVDAAALPADYPKKVWTLRDGRTVAAYGQNGSCSRVRLEVLSQTDKQVRLRFVEKLPNPNQMCTMELRQAPITTLLQKPLGDRELVLDLNKV
jgi:hypothetical protein